MSNPIKTILFSFLCLCIAQGLVGQEQDLTKNTKFFKQKLPEYNDWLEHFGFSKIVEVENYDVTPGAITFTLKSIGKYRNPEFMAQAWVDIREEFEETSGLTLEKTLLEKFAYVMEITPDQTFMKVVSAVPAQFQIQAGYKDGNFYVDETMGDLRGNDDRVKINVKDLKAMGNREESYGDIESTKATLLTSLKNFYQNADSKFGNTPKVDVLQDRDEEFTLLVSNISDHIINTYFELINLNVHLTQEGDEIDISYTVFGKYSSGIFSAPRITSSDYQDMYPKYSAELTLYIDKLGQKIQEFLKKEN